MISRKEALTVIKKYLKDNENVKSALAVETILQKIAYFLEKNEELWALTGLLYNLDYEYCSGAPENRGALTAQVLDGLLPESGINAIKSNNYMHTDYIPTTSLDKSLIAAVTTSNLIFSVEKLVPSKKISDIGLNLLILKFNDQNFASRYNRSRILLCKDLGIEIKEFLALCLKALKETPPE